MDKSVEAFGDTIIKLIDRMTELEANMDHVEYEICEVRKQINKFEDAYPMGANKAKTVDKVFPWLVMGTKDRGGSTWISAEEIYVKDKYVAELQGIIKNQKRLPTAKDLKGIYIDIGRDIGRSGHAVFCRLELLGFEMW